MEIPVALFGINEQMNSKLASILKGLGCSPEMPQELYSWLSRGGVRATVINVTHEADLAFVEGARQAEAITVAVIPELNVYWCGCAIRAGADGVAACEDADGAAIALAGAVAGQVALPIRVLRHIITPELPIGLSTEEIQWLRRLAQGVQIRALASDAGYSQREMYRRLSTLYRRISVVNRSQAIVWATEARLLNETFVAAWWHQAQE